MIRLPDLQLHKDLERKLRFYQRRVNVGRTYTEQVAAAVELWEKYGSNSTFNGIRRTLSQMCCGARRCAYCEDSFADELEHVRPKTLYPEHVFRWPNYVYSCGACNGPKNNNFAVFPTRGKKNPVVVTRRKGDPVKRPRSGKMVLIDPRTEDPLEYLFLDLDSFLFVENAEPETLEWHRANYTIETLRLNRRDEIVFARESAYGSFRARLKEYSQRKHEGAEQTELRHLRNGIRSLHHQTVLAEMQRQRPLRSELQQLFAAIPEAAFWKPLFWEPDV